MAKWLSLLALLPSLLAFNEVPCEDVRVLDCGHDFFREVYQQFQEAKDEVLIMSFFLRPRLKMFRSASRGPPDLSMTDVILETLRRKVHVWIMGWDNSASEKVLGYFQDHEYELLFEAADEPYRSYLHLMLDTGREFLGSVFYLPHIKSIVFDRSVAFVGGIDFTENRGDSWRHARPDAGLVQVPLDQQHPTGNEKPWQDVMARIAGRAAEQVAMVMVERWWTYCDSIGMARTQMLRPVAAILDSALNVKGALHDSHWKDVQCTELPTQGLLGRLKLQLTGQNASRRIRIETPKLQSQGLDPNADVTVQLSLGQPLLLNISGLQALDLQIPGEVQFNVMGRPLTASRESIRFPVYGSTITAQWLPEGVFPEAQSSSQRCKVVLSGSNMWMGTTSTLKESYDSYVGIIRNAKRFLYIENQYFSSDFPSASPDCQHTHDFAKAVLYSGAGNRLGEVLLDRIKRAVRLKEDFSVAFVFPLSTEPGAFYPNLRGAYCFEEAVETFCQAHGVQRWRDYFSFFFLANAVEVPHANQSNAFYGIYTHSKVMIADDSIAYVGSANINDRSLLGDRDAELGVVTWGGSFPKELRSTLLRHHLGDLAYPELNTARFAASLNEVAFRNAEELRETMGISFPDGSFSRNGKVMQLFGMEGLLNHAPLEDAAIPYPRSRVVAGGGGKDHWDWFRVDDAPRAPQLNGQLFPWSRKIWGMPAMTQIAQIFSKDLTYLQTSSVSMVEPSSEKPLFL